MSEVAGRKVVEVGGVEFTVKELTVAEIRRMIGGDDGAASQELDTVGDFLIVGLRLRDLTYMSSLTIDQIEQFRPSQVEEAANHCKAMNRLFFEMEERLNKRLARP